MAWLRALVDNRPRTRQNSSRPFSSSLLYADQVTLVCRIERHGGDWVRCYLILDGVHEIEQIAERGEKDWLGVEAWKRWLEAAGLTRAIGRVLALEQGQTDRLCELSPRELLRLSSKSLATRKCWTATSRPAATRSSCRARSSKRRRAGPRAGPAVGPGQPRHQLPPVPAAP